MIIDVLVGDITSPENPHDIIIGMNADLIDVTGIGRHFVKDIFPMKSLDLGSVISFNFDKKRKLHMIICHTIGSGGWTRAADHIRYGMDYLEHFNDESRTYSIVQIGKGRVGQRDGANSAAIHTAMSTSHLPVTLFVFDNTQQQAIEQRVPLHIVSAWNPVSGAIPLAA